LGIEEGSFRGRKGSQNVAMEREMKYDVNVESCLSVSNGYAREMYTKWERL